METQERLGRLLDGSNVEKMKSPLQGGGRFSGRQFSFYPYFLVPGLFEPQPDLKNGSGDGNRGPVRSSPEQREAFEGVSKPWVFVWAVPLGEKIRGQCNIQCNSLYFRFLSSQNPTNIPKNY